MQRYPTITHGVDIEDPFAMEQARHLYRLDEIKSNVSQRPPDRARLTEQEHIFHNYRVQNIKSQLTRTTENNGYYDRMGAGSRGCCARMICNCVNTARGCAGWSVSFLFKSLLAITIIGTTFAIIDRL